MDRLLPLAAALAVATACSGARSTRTARDDDEPRRLAACSAPVEGSAPAREASDGASPTSDPAPGAAASRPAETASLGAACRAAIMEADPSEIGELAPVCLDPAVLGDWGGDGLLPAEPTGADRGEEPLADEPASSFGRTVVAVRIEGTRTVPARLVRGALRTRVGGLLERDVVAADVQRIWALEAFEDVRAAAEPAEGGVALRLVVVERPLVGRVFLEGASEEVGLEPRLRLLEGQVHQPSRALRLADRLVAAHRNLGHLLAEAEARALRVSDGVVDLCFTVRPGRRITVERLDLVGNERVPDALLLEAVETHGGRVNVAGGIYRADLLDAARDGLLAVLYDHGLLEAHVGEPRVEVDEARGLVRVALPIEEGEPYRLRVVEVSGDLAADSAEYLALVGQEPGEVFDRSEISAALGRIRSFHRQRTGVDATVEPVAATDEARHVVDLRLVVRDP